MWIARLSHACLLLLLALTCVSPARGMQMYAPIVGRWRIDLVLDGKPRTLEFETLDHGVYGLGHGYFEYGPEGGRFSFPAVWWNINPDQIRISSEIDFHDKPNDSPTSETPLPDRTQRGTLILRATFAQGQSTPKGYAVFVDDQLVSHRGSFTMTGIKPSERLGDLLYSVQTKSGLRYIDLSDGTGPEPKPGQTVTINYTGRFEDGREFDNSYKRHEPLKFQIGKGQVIDGWDEGILTMKVGAKRKLIVPPTLAYGAKGDGRQIPPNATLIFEIELTSVE